MSEIHSMTNHWGTTLEVTKEGPRYATVIIRDGGGGTGMSLDEEQLRWLNNMITQLLNEDKD